MKAPSMFKKSKPQLIIQGHGGLTVFDHSSGVARAFPGGRLAHPEGQNEEENK